MKDIPFCMEEIRHTYPKVVGKKIFQLLDYTVDGDDNKTNLTPCSIVV
jgi:hypothetical protein